MSEQGSDQSERESSLHKLNEQLTCSVCLEQYVNPKTLPCLHSFCVSCLELLPVKEQEDQRCISCPTCRQTTSLPANGPSAFQSAFWINNLLEIHEMLAKIQIGTSNISCENCLKEQANNYCKPCSKFLCQSCVNLHKGWAEFSGHQVIDITEVANMTTQRIPIKEQPVMMCSSHEKPLEVYCDTCDKLICYLCTATKQHREHDFEAIMESFQRHRQVITECLQQVKQKIAIVSDVNSTEEVILGQGEAMKKEIEDFVEQLIKSILESKKKLMGKVDQMLEANIEKISAYEKESHIVAAQLKSCEEFAEEELRVGSQQQILAMKKQMVEQMKVVCSMAEEKSLQPPELAKISLLKNNTILEACGSLGRVVGLSRNGFKTATCRQRAKFIIHTTPLPLDQITCQLTPIASPLASVKCDVQSLASDKFEVTYSPPITGRNQLQIQVAGTEITDCFVEVVPKPSTLILSGLHFPCNVAVVQEAYLVVAEFSKGAISIIDIATKSKIKSFGELGSGPRQFNRPWGVAITSDNFLVVTDNFSHRLKVLTMDGGLVHVTGSGGSQPLQFCYPRYVAVHPNGKIFVSDGNNYRVQVLNSNFTFSHCFGGKGDQPGQFNYPFGIAFDSEGMVYVADRNNKRVQKFNSKGAFMAVIGHKGDGKYINAPEGLCIDRNDILYVAEYSNCTVSMFTISGQFLGYIGNSDGTSFKSPRGITVDSSGQLYITHGDEVVAY